MRITLSEAEISERMSGNICRCSAYPNIVDAIREVTGAAHEKLRLCSRRDARKRPSARRGGTATKFIAGGTNLLDLMKLEIETPEKLVDISRLDLSRHRSNRRRADCPSAR